MHLDWWKILHLVWKGEKALRLPPAHPIPAAFVWGENLAFGLERR
jgi:hypothetical protein